MDLFHIYLPIAGQYSNILLLYLIGLAVGILGGFFGVGGAWIVTPTLNIFGFPMPCAIGTDFAHMFGKSIGSARQHGKMENIDWKLGLTIMMGTIPGVESGAQLIMYLERLGKVSGCDIVGGAVRWTYIVMLIGLGSFMLYDYFVLHRPKSRANSQLVDGYYPPETLTSPEPSLIDRIQGLKIPPLIDYPKAGIYGVSIWLIIFIFFISGFISGFLGMGGGFIRMPALVYLLGCPTALAVGTDLLLVMLDGAYGCFTYALKGRIEIFAAVFMLLGVSFGTQLGVTAVRYIRGYSIRLLFACMILFAGLSVTLKQFDVMFHLPRLHLSFFAALGIMGSAAVMCLIIVTKLILNARKGDHL